MPSRATGSLNGAIRSENTIACERRKARQEEELSDKDKCSERAGSHEGRAPSPQFADHRAGRNPEDRAERNTGEDQRGRLRPLLRRHEPDADAGRDRPESTDRHAEQKAGKENRDKIGRQRRKNVRRHQQAREDEQREFAIELSGEKHQAWRSNGRDQSRHRHQQSRLPVRDPEIAGNRRQQPDRQKLRRHKAEGADGDGGHGEPRTQRRRTRGLTLAICINHYYVLREDTDWPFRRGPRLIMYRTIQMYNSTKYVKPHR